MTRRTLVALAGMATVTTVLFAAAVTPAQAATALTSWVPVTSNAASAAYTFSTSYPYWSVVGVKPPTTGDYDLVVDPGAKSAAGGSTVDFVAIDTNLCPGLARTATVKRFSGSGSYTVEFADKHQILQADPLPFPDNNTHIATLFGPGIEPANHFIAVVDIWLHAGSPVELYASQVGGNAGNVYVMAPNPAACVRTPGQALVYGTVNQGSGHSLALRFTPTVTGWFGVVQTSFGPIPQAGYASLRIGQNA